MPEAQQGQQAGNTPAPATDPNKPMTDGNEGAPSPATSPTADSPPATPEPATEDAAAVPEEHKVAGPTDDMKLNAKGQRVLYRAAAKNEGGEGGEEIHAGLITKINDDWSAELTVFPNGRDAFHVHLALLTQERSPADLKPGEWIGVG